MSRTPIEVWPPVTPGRRRLQGHGENDPLRVAERLEYQATQKFIATEAQRRLTDGQDPAAVLDWQTQEVGKVKQEIWERLCNSWSDVIYALRTYTDEPWAKALIRRAEQERDRA